MQVRNQFIKQACGWLCIAMYLSAQQGCASFSFRNLFGGSTPVVPGQVGVASLANAPAVGARGLSRQGGMPRNETLGGTAAGGAGGVGVGFAACSPTIILPWLYPLCIATFGVTGLLVGALVGREAADIKDTKTFAAVLPAGIDMQEALRARVITQASNSLDTAVIDLGAHYPAGSRESKTGSPGLIPATQQASLVDYRKFSAQGIDTVLETNVFYVGLESAGAGQYRLVIQGGSRLVRTADGSEIMSKSHYYRGPEFLQESDTAQGTAIKLQVLNAGLESIALEIGRVYFPQEEG